MMDLFHTDGHLTQDALNALVNDLPLGELERLEIAEHLSFCDLCVANYACLLEDDTLLLSPPQPLALPVLRRIKERARKIFFSKYTTAIAAASLAIVFWNVGVFKVDMEGGNKMLSAMNNSVSTISEKAMTFGDNVSDTIQQIISKFTFERSSNNHEKK